MKKQINVVGAVIINNGNVLAAQRGQGMALAGMWEFPGGKIEENETPQQALQRELQEELKCTAEVGEFVATTESNMASASWCSPPTTARLSTANRP